MSDIRRKKGESFEAFMRRAKRQWQQSGIILQAKSIQHFKKKPAKNVQRQSTVKKIQKVAKATYLHKIGKLPPDEAKRFGL